MKSFLIIGMGNFGHNLCRELAKQKCEIMVVDRRSESVEDVLPIVVSAKVGDCTNAEVLRSFGIQDFDCCFVCTSSDFKTSLQITSLLKELKARKVYSKADDDVHAKFLLRNGADHIIYPEREAAISIAVSESSDDIFDCIPLTADFSIYELSAPEKWIGKNLRELDVRGKYKLNVLAIKVGDTIAPMPPADYVFHEGDHMMVLCHVEDLRKLIR